MFEIARTPTIGWGGVKLLGDLQCAAILPLDALYSLNPARLHQLAQLA